MPSSFATTHETGGLCVQECLRLAPTAPFTCASGTSSEYDVSSMRPTTRHDQRGTICCSACGHTTSEVDIKPARFDKQAATRANQARQSNMWLDAVHKFLEVQDDEAKLFAATMIARTASTHLQKRYLATHGSTRVRLTGAGGCCYAS